jgi:ferredoxin
MSHENQGWDDTETRLACQCKVPATIDLEKHRQYYSPPLLTQGVEIYFLE